MEHRNPSNALFAGYGYGWDAANRMESMDFLDSARDNEDVTFTHDNAGQLTGADRLTSDESYQYDDNGNRELVSRSDGLNQDWVVTANNRLDSDGTFTYAYDDEGNMKSKTRINGSAIVDDFRTEFTWDRRNRLTKVEIKRNATTSGVLTSDPSQMVVTKRVDYYYDMFNRWTKRMLDSDGDTGSATTRTDRMIHDGQEAIIQDFTEYSNSHSFMHGPLPDMVIFDYHENSFRIPLGDHLNTIRDVVGHDGTNWTVINHVTIDTFGRRTNETNSTIEVFHGLGGRPYDEDTGLQNHHNRWYQVDTGRWMSEDPIGFAGGDANLNRFVGNMVVYAVDPTGLQLTPQREGQLVHTFIGEQVQRSNPAYRAFLNREVSTIIWQAQRKDIGRAGNRMRPDIVLVEPGPKNTLRPQCGQAWLYEIKPDTPFWIPVGAVEAIWYTGILNSHGLKTQVGNGTHRGVNGAGVVPNVGPITWRFAGVGVIAYTIKRPAPQPQLVPILVPVPVPQATPVVIPILVPSAPPAINPAPAAPPPPKPQAPPRPPWWFPVPIISDVDSRPKW